MKRRHIVFTVAAVLLVTASFVAIGFGRSAVLRPARGAGTASAVPETVAVGSYNIQAFGPTKLGRPNTLAALAAVGSRFDVLAIQEVGSNASRATEATCEEVMTAYVERLNDVVGKEIYAYVRADQFAIVYRTDLFNLLAWESYSGAEIFAYPPLAVHLRVRFAPFDFVVVSIHVRPTEANSEIASLDAVADEFSALFSERDVILLGDFNADGSYYDEGEEDFLKGFPESEFFTVVPNDADTTVGEAVYAYDRIQLSAAMSEDWTGNWTVLRPADLVDVSVCEGPAGRAGTEAALSDHYPVRAEFYTQRDDD